MKQEEFKTVFPNTFKCLEITNTTYELNLELKQELVGVEDLSFLDGEKPVSMAEVEQQADLLIRNGIVSETMLEDEEIGYIEQFLTEVFEGQLHDIFWEN